MPISTQPGERRTPSRHLPHAPAGRHGVFTADDASRDGWTRSALANAVRTGRLVRLHRGCYVAGEAWKEDGPQAEHERLAIRSVAAVLTTRPAIASHVSAAALADLPVWTIPECACVTVRPRYTGDARHAHLHRATTMPGQIHLGAGIPRTTCSRTVLDIAREHGVEDAVVVGDAALHRGMTDDAALLTCARACAGWPGIRRAEQVLPLLDGRAESPLESISRLRLRRVGLPDPEPQVEIYTVNGVFLGRTDLYWQEFGVVGEVDGRTKYRDAPDDGIPCAADRHLRVLAGEATAGGDVGQRPGSRQMGSCRPRGNAATHRAAEVGFRAWSTSAAHRTTVARG